MTANQIAGANGGERRSRARVPTLLAALRHGSAPSLATLHFMKNAIITGIMAATILTAGCGKSPSSSVTPQPVQAKAASSTSGAQPRPRAIVTKAKSIMLPEFKLDDLTLWEAIQQLRTASKQNDPESKGVNFMISGPVTSTANPKITLALKNVTLEEAMERVAKAARVRVSAEDDAFVFDPTSDKP